MQVLIQGILLVVMSFWITALWFNFYVPKLIFVTGAMAVLAVLALTKAIFTRPSTEHIVQGKVIQKGEDRRLWDELQVICDKVGTAPPDQVILGIDDNFFVTEMPVTVDQKTYRGRTLYVSLSLLKQMNGAEADAVLAHEMAHFSGQDTVYSKKISPLLVRYGHYLDALASGITLPIFYFMHCFRALYELSLTKLNRQREYRADRIATEVASPSDFASGLLRIVAYSHFRRNVQQALFEQEQALESVSISERIDSGFQTYAMNFTDSPEVAAFETAHPFDTHPPIAMRLATVGLPFDPRHYQSLLSAPGDGRWYQKITNAEELEREEWNEFEQYFRSLHEVSLPYRFLPQTEEELAVVVKAFPEVTIEGKKGSVTLTYETIQHSSWPGPVAFREVTYCALDDNQRLQFRYQRDGLNNVNINTKDFKERKQEAIDTISHYYGRYVQAAEYQRQKTAKVGEGTGRPKQVVPKQAAPKPTALTRTRLSALPRHSFRQRVRFRELARMSNACVSERDLRALR